MSFTATTTVNKKEETALEWYQRCQRQLAAEQIPTDPLSAARVFISGKTGLSPIDMAWKLPSTSSNSASSSSSSSVLILEGSIGKTMMVLSLAARFVVSTRPSQFSSNDAAADTSEELQRSTSSLSLPTPASTSPLPQVIILDSSLDMTPRKLLHVVRSTLLRHQAIVSSTNTASSKSSPPLEEQLENDIVNCLERIHIATVDDDGLGWLPVLEALRFQLKQQQQQAGATNGTQQRQSQKTSSAPTTLILWDGYNDHHNQSSEITKQISRLLEECSNVAMVFTTTTTTNSHKPMKFDWINNPKSSSSSSPSRTVHRIHLHQRSGKDCYAIVNGNKRSFSISAGGILS